DVRQTGAPLRAGRAAHRMCSTARPCRAKRVTSTWPARGMPYSMESRPRAGTGLRAVKRATTLNVTLSESAGVTVQSYAPVFASPETMVANGPAGPWRETKTFLERESAGPVAQGHLHVPEQQVGGGIVIQVGELR